MTQISPFPGLRYNPERIRDLARVISPPYDKISTEQREILWRRSEYNAVRLILPPPGDQTIDVATQSTDAESISWYFDAAARFRNWQNAGILTTDAPRFYRYRQTFTYEGKTYTREGLFGALMLDAQSQAHAHEMTFAGPKADRLRLTRATQANLSPVFLLTDGTEAAWGNLFAELQEPILQFPDLENQEHQLFTTSDPILQQSITKFLQERTLVIADGHHRYETALNYRQEKMEQTGKSPHLQPWGQVLVLLVPAASPGLLVLATHRVLSSLPDHWSDILCRNAAPYFEIIPYSEFTAVKVHELLSLRENQNSIFVASADQGFLLVRKKEVAIPALAEVPEPIRELNVSLLHHYLFPVCLGLSPDDLSPITRYIRGEAEALSLVRTHSASAAFLLSSISPQTVFEVSLHGVRMPQKSTDFYPKIPTGLVFRSLSDRNE